MMLYNAIFSKSNVSKSNSSDSHGSHQSAPKYSIICSGLEGSQVALYYTVNQLQTHLKYQDESVSKSVLPISFSAAEKGIISIEEMKKTIMISMCFFKPLIVKFLRHVFKRGTLTPMNHGGGLVATPFNIASFYVDFCRVNYLFWRCDKNS